MGRRASPEMYARQPEGAQRLRAEGAYIQASLRANVTTNMSYKWVITQPSQHLGRHLILYNILP